MGRKVVCIFWCLWLFFLIIYTITAGCQIYSGVESAETTGNTRKHSLIIPSFGIDFNYLCSIISKGTRFFLNNTWNSFLYYIHFLFLVFKIKLHCSRMHNSLPHVYLRMHHIRLLHFTPNKIYRQHIFVFASVQATVRFFILQN